MDNSLIILFLLIVPCIGICMNVFTSKVNSLLLQAILISGLEFTAAIYLFLYIYKADQLFFADKMFFADMLSSGILLLVTFAFFISSIYSLDYFKNHMDFNPKNARKYLILWHLFLLTLVLVLMSNNMGLMWVALEASTLSSAFLILTRGSRASVEAMWKYLLICSVGIGFALIGTILLFAASDAALESTLKWTELRSAAGTLDKGVMIAAFVFILVGFGTKAGIAPMHTWLPDAYSEAPTPVSAVFSSVVFCCSLYCIFRYFPLTEAAMGGSGQIRSLLIFFGIFSIGVAMIFIPAQRDIKRFLAYSSVEHIGIIVTAIGLGGGAVVGGVLHIFYHSMAKMLAFLSAGKITHIYNSRDMDKIKGTIGTDRLWGGSFFIAALTLIGTAPFTLFTSELIIFKSAYQLKHYGVVILLLLGTGLIFITGLRHIFKISFGEVNGSEKCHSSLLQRTIIFILCLFVAGLGLFIPRELWDIFERTARIISG